MCRSSAHSSSSNLFMVLMYLPVGQFVLKMYYILLPLCCTLPRLLPSSCTHTNSRTRTHFHLKRLCSLHLHERTIQLYCVLSPLTDDVTPPREAVHLLLIHFMYPITIKIKYQSLSVSADKQETVNLPTETQCKNAFLFPAVLLHQEITQQ